MGIEWRVAKVRELEGPAQRRRFADKGVIEFYPGAPESVERFLAGAADGLDAELPGVLVELVRQVLLNMAVGTTRVEISQHPFYPGAAYQGFVSQTGRLHVRWFQVQLVCDEQAIHQQGTDTRRAICRVHRSTLFSQRKFDITPQQAFDAVFDIVVPDSAMHSFVSSHNAVMWALLVRGRMARWGDFERRFPIYVYPAVMTKTPAPAKQLTAARS